MRGDQLTVWAQACAQLERRGLLARLSVDKTGVWVEVSKGALRIKKVHSTAEIETAKNDIIVYELAHCAAQIELGNIVPVGFKPWIAGGKDVET